MFRILLVDRDQAVVQDERFGFTRKAFTGFIQQDRADIAHAIAGQSPYDLITVGHAGGYGTALVTAVPYQDRAHVVIISGKPFAPEITEDYQRLGVTQFSGREDLYAQFLNAWAARQRALEPPTDP